MRKLSILLTLTVVAVTLGACATSSGVRGNRITGSHITAADIQSVPWNDAWELLSAHSWLQAQSGGFIQTNRGATTLSQSGTRLMLVVVDGTQLTNNARVVLEGVPVEDIRDIRLLRPSAASTRFGVHGANGAILVRTRR